MSEIPFEDSVELLFETGHEPDFEVLYEEYGLPWGDIFMPDGRRLQWVTNTWAFTDRDEAYVVNDRRLYESATRQGITCIPEIEARDGFGNVMHDSMAIYVDSRIGSGSILELRDFVNKAVPGLFEIGNKASALESEEMDKIVAEAVESLGLTELIAECQQRSVTQKVGKTAISHEQTYDTGL